MNNMCIFFLYIHIFPALPYPVGVLVDDYSTGEGFCSGLFYTPTCGYPNNLLLNRRKIVDYSVGRKRYSKESLLVGG